MAPIREARMRLRSAITVILLLPLLAAGQLTTSVIRGHVSDSSGASVVGAQLKIVNTQTNVERSTTTNNDGDYEAPDLQRGTYRLTLTQPGFKMFVADNIVLESSQIRRIDATLEIGSVGTEVNVQANAAVIETDSAKIQGSFTKQRFADAPWVG